MISAYPVVVRVLSRKSRKTSSGVYYGVSLPDELGKLGWEKGDSVGLKIHEIPGSGGETYIQGLKNRNTRHQMTIRDWTDSQPKPVIQFPIEWTELNTGAGLKFPVTEEQQIVAELDSKKEEMRIYHREGYSARLIQLAQQGEDVDLRLYNADSERDQTENFENLTQGWPGQKVRIVPVRGAHSSFNLTPSDDSPARVGSPSTLFEVVSRNQNLPTLNSFDYVDFKIQWDPNHIRALDYLHLFQYPKVRFRSEKSSISGTKLVSESDGLPPISKPAEYRVELPSIGTYEVTVRAKRGPIHYTGRVWLSRATDEDSGSLKGVQISDEWDAMYGIMNSQQVLTLYVPVLMDMNNEIQWQWSRSE